MPTSNIIFLTAAVCAFVIFGAVLAWGEYRTRKLSHTDKSRTQSGIRVLERAAADAGRQAGPQADAKASSLH
ncbi:MAG TPA: hypothetical protein VMJ52_01650 [Xanthobacteraceae bacterium]|nr:hypothetical protein [Xanthobacteraceae bacterium]